MQITPDKTALVITDPQNDFLSPKGVTWGLVGRSVERNNAVEHIEALFKGAKANGYDVFISPHYYYPTDQGWRFGGTVEKMMHEIHMFDRKGALTLDGFAGSGADWLERYMANSPGLLETYLDGMARFRKDSGFTRAEQEVVLLTISRVNGCDYCMAAHSWIADRMSKVPQPVTEAIRSGRLIPDSKLASLSTFTATLLAMRGLPSKAEVHAFLGAGYSERHVLEIILAIGVMTLSNYSNHLLHTPLNEMFAGREWKESA